MQKIIVTYLAVLVLFQGVYSSTDILFELNEVMEDYQLHKTKYGDNLTTFISKHFGDLKDAHKKQHQKDHAQHKHPVKDQLVNTSNIDFTFNNCYFVIKTEIELNTKPAGFWYINLFSTFEKQKIFHPPQLA
jgi:hypothetical protein